MDVVKLQAAIKYREDDLQNARVMFCFTLLCQEVIEKERKRP